MFVCDSKIKCDRSFCIALTSNEPGVEGGLGSRMLITELAQALISSQSNPPQAVKMSFVKLGSVIKK